MSSRARDTLDDLRVRRVAGGRETGQVALDVGDEDRNARLRQLAGEELQGLGLARSGRARDEAVAVEHRQADLHPRVVDGLAVEHRAAEDEARFGQRVGRRHGVVEPLVHGSFGCMNEALWAVRKRIIGPRANTVTTTREERSG